MSLKTKSHIFQLPPQLAVPCLAEHDLDIRIYAQLLVSYFSLPESFYILLSGLEHLQGCLVYLILFLPEQQQFILNKVFTNFVFMLLK